MGSLTVSIMIMVREGERSLTLIVLGQNWDTLIDGALFVNITSDSSILPQLEFPSDPLPPPYNNTSIISLDVFHQLHCLDVLRRALREKPSEDSGIIWHQNHCVNSVRQALMCSADVTPISFYRDPETKDWNRYMPTFNVKHKCRNIEQIWKWANERHVPVSGSLTGEEFADDCRLRL